MTQPGKAGGVMVRMAAGLAFEIHDPLALLDLACPQQFREPKQVQAMTGSGFVVWRPHDGSLCAGPDEDNTVLVGVIKMRLERQGRPADVADGQHRLGSIGLPPEPGFPWHHAFSHEQSR